MLVVIFRAIVRELDAEYSAMASRLRELAMEHFGCLEFTCLTEGKIEIALSYWPDEASIEKWKAHFEHVLAQELGRKKWYESHTVQVAKIERESKCNV